jgi:hypothetical protein
MTAEAFWNRWRTATQQHTRVHLPLTPRATETPVLMDLCEMGADADLELALERFFTLTPKERSAYNVKAFTLGFLRMALPMLMAEQQQDETEKQKFLDALGGTKRNDDESVRP